PAVGGIAKGHLVREVDALGGIMGEVTDAVGIQFRLLNTSRGPAAWSPRAQCDKQAYRLKMREFLESQPNLKIKQAEVADLIFEDDQLRHPERSEGSQGTQHSAVSTQPGNPSSGVGRPSSAKARTYATGGDLSSTDVADSREPRVDNETAHDARRTTSDQFADDRRPIADDASAPRRVLGIRLRDGRTVGAKAVI